MTFPKILVILSIFLFGSIFVVSYFKKGGEKITTQAMELTFDPVEIDLVVEKEPNIKFLERTLEKGSDEQQSAPFSQAIAEVASEKLESLPETDRIDELFNKREPRLPIVETIIYKSHVPWLKGKSAWIADYSSHYRTSRHFIARSLNGKADYEKQDVKEGDRFNVFNEKKNFDFALLVDLSKAKMWFSYVDLDTGEKVVLKSYSVCVGRPDKGTASGSLTPIGKYKLGDKVAVYGPKTKGMRQGEKIEMVRVFGTRWIPFEEEVSGCSEPAKGLGIHGLPLSLNSDGKLIENTASLGRWESDGCIRMATKDVEELFSIIISRRTIIEIVR